VINRQTHEVIKEIPPEQLLDMIARIWEMIGLLVDEKA
jgi:flagellar protein FlaG